MESKSLIKLIEEHFDEAFKLGWEAAYAESQIQTLQGAILALLSDKFPELAEAMRPVVEGQRNLDLLEKWLLVASKTRLMIRFLAKVDQKFKNHLAQDD